MLNLLVLVACWYDVHGDHEFYPAVGRTEVPSLFKISSGLMWTMVLVYLRASV